MTLRGTAAVPLLLTLALPLAGAVSVPQTDAAKPTLLHVRPDHPLDHASGIPVVEPHLATARQDPARLLAGAIRVAPDREGTWTCIALGSGDRGSTWRGHEFDLDRCIDPWALITGRGSSLMATIELGPGEAPTFRLRVHRSADGSRWDRTPADLGGLYEHPHLLETSDGGIWLAARHMEGTPDVREHRITLLRSTDDGVSFLPTSDWSEAGRRLNVTGLVELPEGAIGVGFESTGFGDEEIPLADRPAPRTGMLRVESDSPTRVVWFDSGCGPAAEFPGYPTLVADADGRRLAHACVGPRLDGVHVTVSDDAGASWRPTVRVDGRVAGAGHARTAMIALNRDGAVGVAWYDRSADDERACQHIRFTGSVDGGATFADPVRVSTESSCPANEANGRVGRSWAMGGDYSSLAASPDGDFHLVWADARDGAFALRHAVMMLSAPSR